MDPSYAMPSLMAKIAQSSSMVQQVLERPTPCKVTQKRSFSATTAKSLWTLAMTFQIWMMACAPLPKKINSNAQLRKNPRLKSERKKVISNNSNMIKLWNLPVWRESSQYKKDSQARSMEPAPRYSWSNASKSCSRVRTKAWYNECLIVSMKTSTPKKGSMRTVTWRSVS